MGLRLSIWGYARLGAFSLAVVGVGVAKAVNAIDHGLNYTEVAAAVDTVEIRCRPSGSSREVARATAGDADWANGAWGDCDAAVAWVYRAGGRMRVERTQVAYLRYISPADRQEHSVTLDIRKARNQTVVAGRRIVLYAHDRDPARFDPA